MDESVYVEYAGITRDVYVDGTRCGKTNTVMTVETGTHTFDLGMPKTYLPPSMTKQVQGTSPLDPLVLTFQPEL